MLTKLIDEPKSTKALGRKNVMLPTNVCNKQGICLIDNPKASKIFSDALQRLELRKFSQMLHKGWSFENFRTGGGFCGRNTKRFPKNKAKHINMPPLLRLHKFQFLLY